MFLVRNENNKDFATDLLIFRDGDLNPIRCAIKDVKVTSTKSSLLQKTINIEVFDKERDIYNLSINFRK